MVGTVRDAYRRRARMPIQPCADFAKEPFRCGDPQIAARLIQQKQTRIFGKRRRQLRFRRLAEVHLTLCGHNAYPGADVAKRNTLRSSTFTEHRYVECVAARRIAGYQRKQRGLAAAVRASEHPAFTLHDRPRKIPEKRPATKGHIHIAHLNNRQRILQWSAMRPSHNRSPHVSIPHHGIHIATGHRYVYATPSQRNYYVAHLTASIRIKSAKRVVQDKPSTAPQDGAGEQYPAHLAVGQRRERPAHQDAHIEKPFYDPLPFRIPPPFFRMVCTDLKRVYLKHRFERQHIRHRIAILRMVAALKPSAAHGLHLLLKSKMRLHV